MVKCLTDNRNRTAPEVRHAFDKNGGNLGQPGCVSFMFEKKGQLGVLKHEDVDEEEFMLLALDLGAEDVIDRDEAYEIITSPEAYEEVRDGLEENGYEFVQSDITFIPSNYTELTNEEDIKSMEKLIDTLEDNDDVQDVYTNWNTDNLED